MQNDKQKHVVIFNYFVHPKYNFTQNIVDWYNSMKENYLVDCDRQFIIYTDNLEAKNILLNDDILFVDIDSSTTDNVQRNLRVKFKYIQDYMKTFNPEFDYFAFIQSNARCSEKITLEELNPESQDLVVCKHSSAYKKTFNQLYGNNNDTVVSTEKIDTSKFTYVCAGHFICTKTILRKICKFVNGSLDTDVKNGTFTKWHDETYFNFYFNTVLSKNTKINILDGNEYAHAWYSKKCQWKIKMLDKKKIRAADKTKHYHSPISVQDLMSHSFVISIDDKRLFLFNKLFMAQGLLPLPMKFQGVCNSDNSPQINCYLSHRNAILMAKELNWPYVCIFEDDAYPINGIQGLINYFLGKIPLNCAVIILGYSNLLKRKPFNEHFWISPKCYGSHAYIVFQEYYDNYIQLLDQMKQADCYQEYKNSIINKNLLFTPTKNLFIQFCKSKSINNHVGYIWYRNTEKKKIKFTDKELFENGYVPISCILPDQTDFTIS